MMGFHYPRSFFLLIAFLLLLLSFAWSRWQRQRDLLNLGDWRLIKEMVPVGGLLRRKKKDLIILFGLLMVIFAACGPQFGSRLQEVKHRGADVFIALDVSRSMLAEDVQPTRLEHAKRALQLLVQKLQGNRVGIIAFAGFAVLQCPLTIDTDAAQMFLDILDTDTVPRQGTAIGDAIRLALKSFKKEDKSGKALVLITDGEDQGSDPEGAAKLAEETGVNIFTIGIGTSKGEVIKDRDEQGKVVSFHKYEGEMVLSRLDDALLTNISQITDGKYFRASSSDLEIDEIANIINGYDKKDFAIKIYKRLQERFQIFVLLALLILVCEFFFGEKPGQFKRIREKMKKVPQLKNKLFKFSGLTLLCAMVLTSNAFADLKGHILKGNKLLKKGDLEGARTEFESAQIDAPEEALVPYNIAGTFLMEGNFEEANRYYEKAQVMSKNPVLKSYIAYNQGYLNFAKGDREGAISKFKESLKYNPKDLDAKYNIEYIKAGKTPQQQFKPQGKPQNQKSDQNKNQDSKQNQGGNQGEDKKPDKEQQKGEMNREDAERVLQMIKDDEKKNLKNARPINFGSKEKEKNENTGKDW
ncbi:MAG: VWA domain-containing protein [Elusimicrobia bacterium]|nr:VWA domain-containing protein [Candidatus Obscuribacterium magneticum]